MLLERGAVGLRVKDIAERAGITPSSVLYYYPRIDELMMEVSREAMERYAERRSTRVRALDDPLRQLRLAIHLGVPTGPDDEESRLLYELDAFVGSSPAFRVLSSAFFDRQVLLYQHVLEAGPRRGPSSWPRRPTRSPAASSRWRTASASRSWWATRGSTALRPSGSWCVTRGR